MISPIILGPDIVSLFQVSTPKYGTCTYLSSGSWQRSPDYEKVKFDEKFSQIPLKDMVLVQDSDNTTKGACPLSFSILFLIWAPVLPVAHEKRESAINSAPFPHPLRPRAHATILLLLLALLACFFFLLLALCTLRLPLMISLYSNDSNIEEPTAQSNKEN